MGNGASIVTRRQDLGAYVHWFGDRPRQFTILGFGPEDADEARPWMDVAFTELLGRPINELR